MHTAGVLPRTIMFDIDAQCAKAIATLDQLTSAATPVEGVPAEDKQKHVHGTLTLKGDEISHAAGTPCAESRQCCMTGSLPARVQSHLQRVRPQNQCSVQASILPIQASLLSSLRRQASDYR